MSPDAATRSALPDSFYNITSIVGRLGANRRTNKRALRHAARPPTRGYWFRRCRCAWCFDRTAGKRAPTKGAVDTAPIVPGDRFMAVAEAITGAYFVVTGVEADRVKLAACTVRVDGVLYVHPRVERLRDTSVWRRM